MTTDFEKRISAVQGYIELGMFADACDELAAIDAQERDCPEVLACRAAIHCGRKEWPLMEITARRLVAEQPSEPQWHISWAHAARHGESIEAARRILLTAVERLPEVAALQYNLACYECLLGELDVAKARLRHAFKLDAKLRQYARQDEDLASLRDWL